MTNEANTVPERAVVSAELLPAVLENRVAAGPVVPVGVDLLATSDSPRLAGENPEYVRVLMESEKALPPILVHRDKMRVIDGMHRLRAAVARGDRHIGVQFFDGDEKDAFVLAVQVNMAHGLPLSLADRTAAATRIIQSHPQWSDRAIASTTGLAAKTVGVIRGRSTGGNSQLAARLGRDGRVRPLDNAEGRRRAGALIARQPDASLRAIARAAGISPTTVRDVRDRLIRGDDPVPPARRGTTRKVELQPEADEPRTGWGDRTAALRRPAHNRRVISVNLWKDPSLRFNEKGRNLLRMLSALAISTEQWNELGAAIPPHSMLVVHEAALACADVWRDFADDVERRLRARGVTN
jgi:ParB-like chromosome segregation protein Spo0J